MARSSRRSKKLRAHAEAHLGGIRAGESPSRSGSRTRRASARRTASCGNGRSAERGRASPPISATKAPTCSARSARRAAWARPWRCPSPTPRPCSSTSTRSPARRQRRPCRAAARPCRLAHDRRSRRPKNITLILLPSRAPELNPVENIWQYLRANLLSNRVFETYDDIIEAACDAWNRLIAQPQTITSIGTREWAIGSMMRAVGITAKKWLICNSIPEIYRLAFDAQARGKRASVDPITF